MCIIRSVWVRGEEEGETVTREWKEGSAKEEVKKDNKESKTR